MKPRKMTALILTFTMISSLIFPTLAAGQETRRLAPQLGRRGITINRYHASKETNRRSLQKHDPNRPAWVNQAVARSAEHLEGQKERFGLKDVTAGLRLRAAEQDDLGKTHLRLEQMHN